MKGLIPIAAIVLAILAYGCVPPDDPSGDKASSKWDEFIWDQDNWGE